MRYRCVEDGSEVICREPPLGAGGEGSVYATARPGLVAKIYHPRRQPTDHMVDKLKFMRDNPPEQPPSGHGHIAITWPRALLERKGRVRGFLLDLSRGESLDKAMNPGERKRFFSRQSWRFSLAVAHNLAWVVEKIHRKDFVIGDVNTQNLRVLPDGQVSIIDTDSFQITVPGRRRAYPCAVTTPEYAAPELTPEMARHGERRPSQDLFSLALLLYGLLACGKHPYNGVFAGKGEPPDTREAIQRGYSLFHPKSLLKAPARGPSPEFLPAELRRLFARAFVDGDARPESRPDAREWRAALWSVINGPGLRTCARNPYHVFPSGTSRAPGALGASGEGDCVWCAWAAALRYDYYDPAFKPAAGIPNRPQRYRPAVPAQPRAIPSVPTPRSVAAAGGGGGGGVRTKGRFRANVRPLPPSAPPVHVFGPSVPAARRARSVWTAGSFGKTMVVVSMGGKPKFAWARRLLAILALLTALWAAAMFNRTLPALHKSLSAGDEIKPLFSLVFWKDLFGR